MSPQRWLASGRVILIALTILAVSLIVWRQVSSSRILRILKPDLVLGYELSTLESPIVLAKSGGAGRLKVLLVSQPFLTVIGGPRDSARPTLALGSGPGELRTPSALGVGARGRDMVVGTQGRVVLIGPDSVWTASQIHMAGRVLDVAQVCGGRWLLLGPHSHGDQHSRRWLILLTSSADSVEWSGGDRVVPEGIEYLYQGASVIPVDGGWVLRKTDRSGDTIVEFWGCEGKLHEAITLPVHLPQIDRPMRIVREVADQIGLWRNVGLIAVDGTLIFADRSLPSRNHPLGLTVLRSWARGRSALRAMVGSCELIGSDSAGKAVLLLSRKTEQVFSIAVDSIQ